MGIRYQISLQATTHQFEVLLTLTKPKAQQTFALPVWIPGSYLVREFARHLSPVAAEQAGQPVPISQQDKATWQVQCDPQKPLTLRYSVYGHDASVRTAWLDAGRGFFNPTSLCLQALGDMSPLVVLLSAPSHARDWTVTTGARPLKVNASGWGTYQFDDYDELADSPFELGPVWRASFTAGGIPHQLAVAQALPSFDGDRLLADTQKICRAQIAFWHGKKKAPHSRYAFLLATVEDGYGGLEHQHSTALICKRADLPRVNLAANTHSGYQDLLGLISHEYFHTWNVKRMRPKDLTRYDYSQENYTSLLWFFEGFTSYYDDLFLVRAGLFTPEVYLQRLGKTWQQVLATPGRLVQPLSAASFDAWIRYYRPDENTVNSTVSYYTKGALVALCLDLQLRREGHGTLDDVMRHLWTASKGGPIDEQDVLAALQAVGQRSYQAEIDAWVHGTAELPVAELLAAHGVSLKTDKASPEMTLGLKLKTEPGLVVSQVLVGGAAQQAGFAPGDEWLAVRVGSASQGRGKPPASEWRIKKLADLSAIVGKAREVEALVSRDQRLIWLPLTLPDPAQVSQLHLSDAKRAAPWLGAPA
jgi:predicted metalloprotease with PDZ domain